MTKGPCLFPVYFIDRNYHEPFSAQGLYQKYAFVQVGRRKGYYTNNREDALIMTTPRVHETGFVEPYKQLKAELRQRLLEHLEHKTAG